MSEFKGTPGPWRFVSDDDWRLGYDGLGNAAGRFVGDANGKVIAASHLSHTGLKVPPEMIANAHAIAAVPDLIAALRGLMEGYEDRMGDWENADFNECYRVARAALAKATGGT